VGQPALPVVLAGDVTEDDAALREGLAGAVAVDVVVVGGAGAAVAVGEALEGAVLEVGVDEVLPAGVGLALELAERVVGVAVGGVADVLVRGQQARGLVVAPGGNASVGIGLLDLASAEVVPAQRVLAQRPRAS
jgi:hypothetical protein